MARKPRRMSASGYMHIIVRGVGKQILFEDNMDYRHFLDRLEQYSMDLSVIKTLIGDWVQYEDFMNAVGKDECLEYDSERSDDWAITRLKECLNVPTGTVLRTYRKAERDAALVKLKECGLSVRQIERLTGINRNVIQRAGRSRKKSQERTSPPILTVI